MLGTTTTTSSTGDGQGEEAARHAFCEETSSERDGAVGKDGEDLEEESTSGANGPSMNHQADKTTEEDIPPMVDLCNDKHSPTNGGKTDAQTVQEQDTNTGNSLALIESSTQKKNSSSPFSYRIFFVTLGRTFPPKRVEILKKRAQLLGANVTDDLFHATHVVLDETVEGPSVAAKLGYKSAAELKDVLEEHNIQTVKPGWIAKAGGPTLLAPRIDELWNGLASIQKRKRTSTHNASENQDAKRPAMLIRATESRIASNTNDAPRARNMELSKLFLNISKCYQKYGINAHDEWGQFTYNKAAGRLRRLDFDIVNDKKVLARVAKVPGIGSSSMRVIREWLERGTCSKIVEYEKDPQRRAIKAFKDIWGVGPAEANKFYASGYRTIQDIRTAIASGKLHLTRNQLVGVQCYEDLLEHMSRSEVEAIGNVVQKTVLALYLGAEILIMGSYRRGKSSCGDIDLLIVHPDHVATTPYGALGKIVDRLRQDGHMSYHLTTPAGMTTPLDPTDEARTVHQTTLPFAVVHHEHESSSSQMYMGILRSPVPPHRKRRIDIKFYPYRERAFASLYFTGNGFFNRSMRLYAKEYKKMSLNDHGLFPLLEAGETRKAKKKKNIPTPTERLPIEAETERDVFDILDLVYKEPTERDCFDAVVPKNGERLREYKDHEVKGEERQYIKWVD